MTGSWPSAVADSKGYVSRVSCPAGRRFGLASLLNPVLFLVYISDVLDSLNTSGKIYADGVKLCNHMMTPEHYNRTSVAYRSGVRNDCFYLTQGSAKSCIMEGRIQDKPTPWRGRGPNHHHSREGSGSNHLLTLSSQGHK